jgi:hypothetical protein
MCELLSQQVPVTVHAIGLRELDHRLIIFLSRPKSVSEFLHCEKLTKDRLDGS